MFRLSITIPDGSDTWDYDERRVLELRSYTIPDGSDTEIAASQKQYEYYRDKLLTFIPLST